MRRLIIPLIGFVVLVYVAVGLAQPPAPPVIPPAPPPPAFAPPPAPAAFAPGPRPAPAAANPGEASLAKFEPLAAFPAATQFAVRSAIQGSNWLTRMNQVQGRFVYGYNPALRQTTEGDHDLKQALAARALAQSAKFTGDDRQAAVATQAVLTLLAATRVDPADPNCRVPARASTTCNRVGFAAVLALCIYELPATDERLIAEAERLCEFLRKQLRPDGSVHYTDNPTDNPTQIDPDGINEYPGFALHAVMVSNRVRPAAWKPEAVQRGLAYYRGAFKARPHPMLAATLTPAFAELYLQMKSADAASMVFELNDWLAGLQYPSSDPRHPTWVGGFRGWANGQAVDSQPGFECGAYLQSLSCAYLLNRHVPDQDRDARYKQSALDAVQFLTGLQYTDANTRHFDNAFRASVLIGGFYLSPTDGNLRIDATAWAVTGMLRFLGSGAER